MESLDLQVTGRGGVPATGVTAVALNVTAAFPTAESYLTAWPAGESRPTASNLNYRAGVIVPNLVVVKVPPSGLVSLYNNAGQTDVVADVVGWFGQPAVSVGVTRAVAAHDFFFNPDNVVAPAGSTVTMTFTNASESSEQHTFTSPPVGVDQATDAGGQVTFTFTMPGTATGFYCRIHNIMVGTLTPG
jgi:plastocyanin